MPERRKGNVHSYVKAKTLWPKYNYAMTEILAINDQELLL